MKKGSLEIVTPITLQNRDGNLLGLSWGSRVSTFRMLAHVPDLDWIIPTEMAPAISNLVG
jgi:hypothetical protein